jgi:chemotaxis protein MotB
MLRVQGLAASSLLDAKEPTSPVNRRISIIVMNRDAEDRFFRTAPDSEENADGTVQEPVGPELRR